MGDQYILQKRARKLWQDLELKELILKKNKMLKEIFLDLLTKYTDNKSLINELWIEIEKYYADKKRHYHTLQHLDNLLNQLTEVKGELLHWETILFTLYYHDIIYNPLKSDNEEKAPNSLKEE